MFSYSSHLKIYHLYDYIPANAAFIATVAAADGLSPDDNKNYAMSQINYLLGDNKLHISYEIGFGNKFPKRPHHRGRSVMWSCLPSRNQKKKT